VLPRAARARVRIGPAHFGVRSLLHPRGFPVLGRFFFGFLSGFSVLVRFGFFFGFFGFFYCLNTFNLNTF
jgi:hypothetical protein